MAIERRTQLRIDLRIPVELTYPGRDAPVQAVTRDLSWGGALLHLTDPLPRDLKTLIISLPWRRGKSIHAQAKLLRVRPDAAGGYLAAVRFTSLSPRSQSRLERLLKMLYSADTKGDAAGKNALFRELEVTVSDAEELRQTLLQILEGRYTVTVFEPYEVGQSISLSITGTFDLPDIRLRAQISGVQKSRVEGFNWADLYTLSLEFEHPGDAIRALIAQILSRLSDSEDQSSIFSSLEGAPDWLRSVATAVRSSMSNRKADVGVRDEVRSCLESERPEAVERLIAGWGNVNDFDVVFQDLVLSRDEQPPAWSQEAWDELKLLQSVHDEVYGAPPHRNTWLRGGRL